MSQVQRWGREAGLGRAASADNSVLIVGGGLAGSEAAWRAANSGARVTLCEMRPARMTEAHRTGSLAELVCSNSFKSESLENANGLLKFELGLLGSLTLRAAVSARVPAGSALCVDREKFAAEVTHAIESHPRIEVVRAETEAIPEDRVAVLAPGPLASPSIAKAVERLVGSENLFFYDAVSPIVESDSIDFSRAYRSSRYGKGDATYVNLPLEHDDYTRLLCALREAELTPRRDFEEARYFSACMPIEEVAKSGEETLAHGCMKPVGLEDPRTGRRPYAVVQLRPENLEGTLYGLVGFQTRLKHGEQERIFRALPGLERARFARLGSVHRNTYINGPSALTPAMRHSKIGNVFFAGQITGSEGYMAAAATGLLAGLNAARQARSAELLVPPPETILGGLARYVSQQPAGSRACDYKPMNPNFGLVPPLGARVRDRRRRNLLLSERAASALREWIRNNGIGEALDAKVDSSGVLS